MYGNIIAITIAVVGLSSGDLHGASAEAVGNAFTYQGQLKQNGVPVNCVGPEPPDGCGGCAFTFRLYDDAVDGNQVGAEQNRGIEVKNGLFTVDDLDFGADAFTGEARWLEIEVKCPDDVDPVTLDPRQAVTAAPYALSALSSPGIFNVLAFGAVPNDGINDSDAINTAVRAARDYGDCTSEDICNTCDRIENCPQPPVNPTRCGGAVVYIPPGKYLLNGPINLTPTKNMRIVGSGASSVLEATGTFHVFEGGNVTYLEISDLRIQGQFHQGIQFNDSCFLTFRNLSVSGATVGPSPRGMSLIRVSDVQILNCHFEGNGLDPMTGADTGDIFVYYGGSRIRIVGNTCVSENVLVNIGLKNTVDSRIENNLAAGANTTLEGDHGGYGIMVYRDSGEKPAERNIIVGNVVRDTQGSGIYVQGSAFTTVADNVIENTCSKQVWGTLIVAGIAVTEGNPSTPGAVTISGNVVRNSYQDGIAIQGRGFTVSGNMVEESARRGIWLNTVRASTVTGNSIRNCNGGIHNSLSDPGTEGVTIVGNSIWGGKCGSSLGGIELFNITASTVANNVVVEAQGYGIVIDGSRNIISGNVVRDASQLDPNVYDGLYLRGAGSERNIVFANHIFNSAAPGQRYGIVVGGSQHQIVQNDVMSNGLGGMLMLGTATTVKNNRGWITEMKGTGAIASGSTSFAVDHGLSVTPGPEDIAITLTNNPANDVGAIWVSTVNGSQFTVNCANDPGTPGLFFAWHASVLDGGTCGNGIQEPGEQCDDGNTLPCDNCDGACLIEACGNGAVQCGEVCDDGFKDDCGTCNSDCSAAGTGTCGDGDVCPETEVCDDGNGDNSDSCPDGDGGSCAPACCGDGFIWNTDGGTEVCDDGDGDKSDSCPDGGGATCVPAYCGDGFIWNTDGGTEVCDDRNTVDCDGCRGDCSAVEGTCGDGERDPLCEECDDGNTEPGDGCNQNCRIE